MTTGIYFAIIFKIMGSLALLIYGMKVMSEALQKMAGSQLRHLLGAMTTNRFTGMLTGTFITCAVQSSSATTVMTVSFVNAGLLTLAQAISVIMGANIGTTLTAWIMSLGYSVDLTSFVFPAFLVGIVLIYTRRMRYVGDFLFGLSFMFFSLVLLSDAGKALHLDTTPAVIEFFKSFDINSSVVCCGYGYHHFALFYRRFTYLSWYCIGYGRKHWNHNYSQFSSISSKHTSTKSSISPLNV